MVLVELLHMSRGVCRCSLVCAGSVVIVRVLPRVFCRFGSSGDGVYVEVMCAGLAGVLGVATAGVGRF